MLVGEVMIANPKTLPSAALVGDVRSVFEKKNVRTVLLAEGDAFRGAIERDGCRAALPTTSLRFASPKRSRSRRRPRRPMRDVLSLLDGREEPRLVVLDEDGVTLRGLLCADTAGSGFCVR